MNAIEAGQKLCPFMSRADIPMESGFKESGDKYCNNVACMAWKTTSPGWWCPKCRSHYDVKPAMCCGRSGSELYSTPDGFCLLIPEA